MDKIEQKLKALGIDLPNSPAPIGAYVPAKASGKLVYVSGQLPLRDRKLVYEGKLGSDLTVEQGYEASTVAAINSISVIKSLINDLELVSSIVKVTGYISSAPGFTLQADVLNGASELFATVFGEKGKHTRVAVGVAELPINSPVEIEVIAEIASADYTY